MSETLAQQTVYGIDGRVSLRRDKDTGSVDVSLISAHGPSVAVLFTRGQVETIADFLAGVPPAGSSE